MRELIKPTVAARRIDHVAYREDYEIDDHRDRRDYGVAQERDCLEWRMDDKHRVDIVCCLSRDQCLEDEITIQPYHIHHNYRDSYIADVTEEAGLQLTEYGDKQYSEEESSVCKNTLCHLEISERGIDYEIYIGEHSDQGRGNAEPEYIVREKDGKFSILSFQYAVYEATPHYYVARIYRQDEVRIVADIRERIAAC